MKKKTIKAVRIVIGDSEIANRGLKPNPIKNSLASLD